ncbi:Nramp family divalent metal transporter [Deinococcus sp. VB343]
MSFSSVPDQQPDDQATPLLSGMGNTGRKWNRIVPFIGPAVVASVAYMDPGNFATNIEGGAKYGYALLWVILGANLMAMLIQNLSARLGIASGRNLPELVREQWPKPVSRFYWVQAELVAMATDLAEFLGAALAIHLLTGLPMIWGAVVTGVITFWLLSLQKRGTRPLELVIGAFVLVIGVSYLAQLVLARPELAALGAGFVPHFPERSSVYLAVGIIGATVMPHVIYLHSALTQRRIRTRNDEEKRRLARLNLVDVVGAMGLAGLINMSMLAAAAATFHGKNLEGAGDLTVAYQTLTPLLGSAASVLFALALLASGLSSSAVGTMAGDVIMQGFVGFRIPLWLRRTVTMLPAFVVILLGLDTTQVLILSQVVLSFGVPFALVPLLVFSRRRDLMGVLTASRSVAVLGWAVAALIIGLNVFLLWGLLGGR